MNQLISHYLDFLFPKISLSNSNIHQYLTREELYTFQPTTKEFTETENKFQVLTCANYDDELVRDLLHRAKFDGELAIAEDLAELIWINFKKSNNDFSVSSLITSVPVDLKRWQQRNYHLPQLLARKLSKKSRIRYTELFKKTKHTESQVNLPKEDREKVLEGLFEIKDESLQAVDKLFIVDDIVTTGATLRESVRAVRAVAPKTRVFGLVVAG